MKYIITESQFNRYKKLVREYIGSMKYPGVCKIEVMEDENEDKIYVHVIFSAEWYVETVNANVNIGEMYIVKKVVGTIAEIKKELEDMFSPIQFYVGHSIRANKDC